MTAKTGGPPFYSQLSINMTCLVSLQFFLLSVKRNLNCKFHRVKTVKPYELDLIGSSFKTTKEGKQFRLNASHVDGLPSDLVDYISAPYRDFVCEARDFQLPEKIVQEEVEKVLF